MTDPDQRWEIRVISDLTVGLVGRTAEFFDEHFPGVFGGPCDPEVFRWKLGDANPAGPGILALATTDDGTIAGVMTATMKRMIADGRTLRGAETGDTFTHPDFRRSGGAATAAAGTDPDHYLNRSVFGRLVHEVSGFLDQRGVEVVYSTPNDQSRPGYCRRGGYEVARGAASRSWHCPRGPIFRSRLPLSTGGPASRAFDLVRRLANGPSSPRPALTTVPLRVDTPVETYRCIDQALEIGRSRRSERPTLAVLQDGAWIRHRYGLHPSQSYVLHLIGEPDRPSDFMVTRTITRSHGASTRCIAEWSPGLADDARACRGALRALVDDAHDVDTVSVWTDDRPATHLQMLRSGFLPLSPVSVVLGTNPFGRRALDEDLSFPMHIGWSDNV